MFKLYLTGIETLNRTEHNTCYKRSNCTLLELKRDSSGHHRHRRASSNCTLLELKQGIKERLRSDKTFKLYLTGIETVKQEN